MCVALSVLLCNNRQCTYMKFSVLLFSLNISSWATNIFFRWCANSPYHPSLHCYLCNTYHRLHPMCFTLLCFFYFLFLPCHPHKKVIFMSARIYLDIYLFCSLLCPQWPEVCLAHSGCSTCWMNSVKEEDNKRSKQEILSQSLLPFRSGTHFYFFGLKDIDNRRDSFSWIIKYVVATCM